MINFIQLTVNGLLIGGIYALISIGLNLIFGVTNVVNFAHGELLMISMYLSYWLLTFFGLDPYVSILIILPLMFLIGVLLQRVVIQQLLDAPHHMQIFATVGLSIIMINGALLLWKADYRPIATAYSSAVIALGAISVSVPKLVGFVLAIAITVALFLFLKLTPIGRAIRATAQDKSAAMLMGVDVKKIYWLAFGLGSATVGAAGVILAPMYFVFPTIGTYFVLTAFVVVVLGGLGSMNGALLGGVLIGLVEVYSGYFINPAFKELGYFVLFILVLIFRPQGLFGLGRTD